MSTITEQLGRVLAGRYRLEAAIGTGASAHVYAAIDTRLGRRVAAKVLHPGLAGDEAFVRRFRVEAQAVAALSHPNVLSVFDWGVDGDEPFLVLEYLPGGSLADLFDSGRRLTLPQATRLGTEAARGLAYAHRRGLVHRDVKPANLLLDEEGSVRIADFGLARALAEAAWTEPIGAVIGTARYASPEQAEGRRLDDRSDVYSLALVLFEAVVGRAPFSGDTTLALLSARVGASLPMVPELGPLAPILAQAAITDPIGRLDAAELASQLELLGRQLPPAEPLLDPGALPPSRGARSAPGDLTAVTAHEPSPEDWFGRRASRTAAAAPGPAGRHAALGPAGLSGPARTDRPATTGRPAADSGPDTTSGPVTFPAGGSDTAGASDTAGGRDGPEGPDGRERTRRRWPRRLAAALTVLVLVAGAGAGALRFVVFAHRIPAVVGRRLSVARSLATRAGLRLEVQARRYSGSAPGGVVLAQLPPPGGHVRSGTALLIVVSRGPAPVEVPAGLAGRTERAAAALLGHVHLTPSVATAYEETVPAGTVVSASPPSGLVSYGGRVGLVVSKGPRPRTIPQLGTDSWTVAASDLTRLRLVPVQRLAYSSTVPAGQVIATEPTIGTGGVAVGSTVKVTVSKGPRLVDVPAVGGQPIAAAVAALEQAGLQVTEQIGPPFATKASTTDPGPGSAVRPGSSVTLYVS